MKQIEDLKNEIWKDIPDYEGIYQVSNMGRFIRVGRKKTRGSHCIEDRLLKPSKDKNGYLLITLSKEGKAKAFKTHRVVLRVFTFISDLHVDHINGIKDDNRLVNLRYCTNRENSVYYFSNVTTTSNYIGVCKVSLNKWRASIRILGKQYYLGNYSSEVEAYDKYIKALNDWTEFKTLPKYINENNLDRIVGISWKKSCQKWQVIYKEKYIGLFSDKEDAIKILNEIVENKKV